MGKGDWAKRSDEFTGLVRRMLRSEAAGRWSSMSEVRKVLRDFEVAESPNELHRKTARNIYMRIQMCGVEGRKFFERFYENLFSVLPEVKRHFESTDMEGQHRILNDAMDTLLDFCPDSQTAKRKLNSIALRHVTYGLTRHHYTTFLDTLVKTIEEVSEKDPRLLAALRSTLEPGIDFMWNCQEKHQSRGLQTPA